jgi:hypothetical protein
MSWFARNKDLIGILAVILSLVTVLIQKRGQRKAPHGLETMGAVVGAVHAPAE